MPAATPLVMPPQCLYRHLHQPALSRHVRKDAHREVARPQLEAALRREAASELDGDVEVSDDEGTHPLLVARERCAGLGRGLFERAREAQ